MPRRGWPRRTRQWEEPSGQQQRAQRGQPRSRGRGYQRFPTVRPRRERAVPQHDRPCPQVQGSGDEPQLSSLAALRGVEPGQQSAQHEPGSRRQPAQQAQETHPTQQRGEDPTWASGRVEPGDGQQAGVDGAHQQASHQAVADGHAQGHQESGRLHRVVACLRGWLRARLASTRLAPKEREYTTARRGRPATPRAARPLLPDRSLQPAPAPFAIPRGRLRAGVEPDALHGVREDDTKGDRGARDAAAATSARPALPRLPRGAPSTRDCLVIWPLTAISAS
jgi:hypothetical protein